MLATPLANGKFDIRQHLAEWQEKNGQRNLDIPLPFDSQDGDSILNDSMRLGSRTENLVSEDPEAQDGEDPVSFRADEDTTGAQYEYLSPGDLVEIP